jgi:uncharacterized protein YbjT (DUF2867 family)
VSDEYPQAIGSLPDAAPSPAFAGGRSPGTVLVLGSAGFIAGFVIAALRREGWTVVRGVRSGVALAADGRWCDLSGAMPGDCWRAAVDGVDVVVNAAGILRETVTQRFDPIHHDAPLTLARACVDAGVRRFVQISALGHPDDGPFIASKHRFDETLLRLPLSAVVLRPSVVYSPRGSYGGTSLLRAMAGLPAVLPLPGNGGWQLQPVSAECLGALVARAAVGEATGVFEVGGPAAMSLDQYQRTWRHWLRVGRAATLRVPTRLVSLAVAFGEHFGVGPLGETMWKMLQRGNLTTPDAHQRLQATFGVAPRSLEDVLSTVPSQVQDRWHARLYWLAPTLRGAVASMFILSAVAGMATPASTIDAMTAGSLIEGWHPVPLARGAGVMDLLLGAWLLSGRATRTAITCMLLLVLVYTVVFGLALPQSWLEPLGGMAKNLVVLPALAVLWVLSDRR